MGFEKLRADLGPGELPERWYNVLPDLPEPLPPAIDPPGGFSRIALRERVFPRSLIEQDSLRERWVDIPEEVRDGYLRMGRPTPLQRAVWLERHLDTPARIYLKREDVLPTGSFKINTSLPQAYYARRDGFSGVVSQTGAGQWGSALAVACSQYGLACTVFMSRVSYHQKPYRRMHMEMHGARVFPSPSDITRAGRAMLERNPDHPGSVNSGISEAIETALENPGTAYVNGSNLPHILMHNTVIGLEAEKQLELLGERPDVLIACVGGGSNLGGLMLPFLPRALAGEGITMVAVESTAAPRLTRGEYRYEHGDPAGLTPLAKAYTLGAGFVPPPNHVGGLRQHGGSPIVSLLRGLDLILPRAYDQEEVFECARLFARLEGIVPAPETAHAIKAAVDEAARARDEGAERVILVGFSGHGLLDLAGYDEVLLKRGREACRP